MTPAEGPRVPRAGGPRYRLRPSIEPFVDAAGDLYLVRPGAPDLVVRGADAADVAVVEHLARGEAPAAPLLRALLAEGVAVDAAALDDKLRSLVAADAVVVRSAPPGPPLDGEDAERFKRQLPYLAELGDELALQRRLRGAAVAVIGCGGLGTWSLAALASAGVGRFVLVDDDVVELSNLNRQVLFRRADLGRSKVAVAAEWARAFDPAVQVEEIARRITGAAELEPIVSGVDAVVLAADWPPYELGRWVNAACVAARTPFIAAGQLPPVLKIGPLYVPGAGACFACHEAALRRASPAYDDYVAWRRDTPAEATTLGPASAVIGGLIGTELLHLLAGRRPATQDTAIVLDMRTLELRREAIRREPGCAACKHLD